MATGKIFAGTLVGGVVGVAATSMASGFQSIPFGSSESPERSELVKGAGIGAAAGFLLGLAWAASSHSRSPDWVPGSVTVTPDPAPGGGWTIAVRLRSSP